MNEQSPELKTDRKPVVEEQSTEPALSDELRAKFDDIDNASASRTRELLDELSAEEHALYLRMKDLARKRAHEEVRTRERLAEVKDSLDPERIERKGPKVIIETPSLSTALSQDTSGDLLQKLDTKDAFWRHHQSELKKFIHARGENMSAKKVEGDQLKLSLEMEKLISEQIGKTEGVFAELEMRTRNIEAIKDEFEKNTNTGDTLDYIRAIGALSARLANEEKEVNVLNLEISTNARDLDDMTTLYRQLTHTGTSIESMLPSLKSKVDTFAGRAQTKGIPIKSKVEYLTQKQPQQQIQQANHIRKLDLNNWQDIPLILKETKNKFLEWWRKL